MNLTANRTVDSISGEEIPRPEPCAFEAPAASARDAPSWPSGQGGSADYGWVGALCLSPKEPHQDSASEAPALETAVPPHGGPAREAAEEAVGAEARSLARVSNEERERLTSD